MQTEEKTEREPTPPQSPTDGTAFDDPVDKNVRELFKYLENNSQPAGIGQLNLLHM